MKMFSIGILSLSYLTACAATPINATLTTTDVSAFIDAMLGEFETSPENKDTQILDRRIRIVSPNLQGDWVYTQLNTGPEKKVYRQRVSNFAISDDGNSILQRSYTLKQPEDFTAFWAEPEIFNSLSDDDMNRFANEGCVQKWTRTRENTWKGYVDPKTCIINSKRRNVDIRIEAEANLSGDTYKTNERGFNMDMEQIWGSEPNEFITLKRD